MFQPWIGDEYSQTRFLILGESAFSWWEDDEEKTPSLRHSIESVEWAIENFPHCGRFFNMLSRALAGEESPDKPKLRNVWNSVAFTNYISDTVGEGPRNRPSTEMWVKAKQNFISDLSALFDPIPTRAVILGKDMWEEMPETNIWITNDVQEYIIEKTHMTCVAVSHPAGGLSWQHLSVALRFARSLVYSL